MVTWKWEWMWFLFFKLNYKTDYTETFYAEWDIFLAGWYLGNQSTERIFKNTTWNVGYLSLRFCSDNILFIASKHVFFCGKINLNLCALLLGVTVFNKDFSCTVSQKN